MSEFLHVGLFGSAGSGKSTMGLSFNGVEQNVFGSSEELTAKNFPERVKSGDILPPMKLDWMEFLKPEERSYFDGTTKDEAYIKSTEIDQEKKLRELQQLATARKIIRYRRYILKTKDDLANGRRPELKTLFLDNGTPFLNDYLDYQTVVFGHKYKTTAGNWDSIKFSMDYAKELDDFFELFNSLQCNTVASFHIKQAVDEETSSKVDFMKDAQKGVRHSKEWHPMIMGQFKYNVTGKFDYAFYVRQVDELGKPNRFIGTLELDSVNGVGKSRIQPFDNPKSIEIPKNTFYSFLVSSINKKLV